MTIVTITNLEMQKESNTTHKHRSVFFYEVVVYHKIRAMPPGNISAAVKKRPKIIGSLDRFGDK